MRASSTPPVRIIFAGNAFKRYLQPSAPAGAGLACICPDVHVHEALSRRPLEERSAQGCHRIRDAIFYGGLKFKCQVVSLETLRLNRLVGSAAALLQGEVNACRRPLNKDPKRKLTSHMVELNKRAVSVSCARTPNFARQRDKLSSYPNMLLLEATGVSKSYFGVRALKSVSFDLRAGEVHALVGENGAGKSTLIKIVTGAVAHDSGSLRIAGRLVEHHNPVQAHSLGIAVVYQQPALFPDLTVAENIALGLERGGPWRRIDWKARARLAREALARAGAQISPDARVSTLSMPEQQIVEIAKAIGARSKILILDEPTASLTDREVERLFQVIATVRGEGAGIVYISHRLEEVSAIADRVTVLRDGETIATCDAKGLARAELIRMMVGREIDAIFPKRAVPIGEVALEVRESHLARGRHPRRFARSARRRNPGTLGPGRLRPHPARRNHLRTHARRERRDSRARPPCKNRLPRGCHPPPHRLRPGRPAPARRCDADADQRQRQPRKPSRGLPRRIDRWRKPRTPSRVVTLNACG